MTNRASAASAEQPKARLVGGPALLWMRWVIIATVLSITLLWPVRGNAGLPLWQLAALFAGYNLLMDLLQPRIRWLRVPGVTATLDLLAAGGVYFMDHQPGGPTFILFYLVILSAVTTLSLRGVLLYTVAIIAVVILIAPTLPFWSATPENLRQLSSRIVVLALVGVGSVVTARRLARELVHAHELRIEAERLAELDRLRNDFIASISHDLRTPLTAARAGLGLLQTRMADQVQPEDESLWNNVRRNIDRLGHLIDDLITSNQLKAGTLELDQELLDLRGVVTDAIAALYPLFQGKQQTLQLLLLEPLPVVGDPRRLEQVVVNILANGYQHTPTGTCITIAGSTTLDKVQLAIKDTGPGIPSEELESIFQRFHRLDKSGGSGLGLAIARSIVELHGGCMWAESELGIGTTFAITLPKAQQGQQ